MPKPQYWPTGALRHAISENGYDPGDADASNADPAMVNCFPGSNPPGEIPSLTDPSDGGHPSVGSAGSPVQVKHSKRTTNATDSLPGT